MRIYFPAPLLPGSTQAVFALQDAALEADLTAYIAERKRMLARHPSSAPQIAMLQDAQGMRRKIEGAEDGSVRFDDAHSYLVLRYSERIASANFDYAHCEACKANVWIKDLSFSSFEEGHGLGRTAGRQVSCRCGMCIWRHFDQNPK